MSLPVFLRPEAEADLREIYEYLDQFGSSKKFSERLRQTLSRIENFPELYGIVWEDVRAVRLRKFMYVLYYIAFEDRVDVLAILHGARNVEQLND